MSDILVRLGLRKDSFTRDVKQAKKEIEELEKAANKPRKQPPEPKPPKPRNQPKPKDGEKSSGGLGSILGSAGGIVSTFVPIASAAALAKSLYDVAKQAREANRELNKALSIPRLGAAASVEALNAQLERSHQLVKENNEKKRERTASPWADWGTKIYNAGQNAIGYSLLGKNYYHEDDIGKRDKLEAHARKQKSDAEAAMMQKTRDIESERKAKEYISESTAEFMAIERRKKEAQAGVEARVDISPAHKLELKEQAEAQARTEETALKRKLALEEKERATQLAISQIRGTENEKRLKQLDAEIELLRERATLTGDGDKQKELASQIAMKQVERNKVELDEWSKTPEQRRAEKQQQRHEAQQRRIAEARKKRHETEQARKDASKKWDDDFASRRPEGITVGKKWNEKEGTEVQEGRVPVDGKKPSVEVQNNANRTDAAIAELTKAGNTLLEKINEGVKNLGAVR